MKILKIKRSLNNNASVKIYGTILGDEGKTYRFGYVRRSGFRGWLCGCDSFLLTQFSKKRNCKHLRFVRSEVGRYGATVTK